MNNFLASLGCMAIFLLVLASFAVSVLCIYAIYWLLGYYTEWPWFIKVIVAVVSYGMITGILTRSARG